LKSSNNNLQGHEKESVFLFVLLADRQGSGMFVSPNRKKPRFFISAVFITNRIQQEKLGLKQHHFPASCGLFAVRYLHVARPVYADTSESVKTPD
jgi:hypothetical protein